MALLIAQAKKANSSVFFSFALLLSKKEKPGQNIGQIKWKTNIVPPREIILVIEFAPQSVEKILCRRTHVHLKHGS